MKTDRPRDPVSETPHCTSIMHNEINCISAKLRYKQMCPNCQSWIDKAELKMSASDYEDMKPDA